LSVILGRGRLSRPPRTTREVVLQGELANDDPRWRAVLGGVGELERGWPARPAAFAMGLGLAVENYAGCGPLGSRTISKSAPAHLVSDAGAKTP